MGVMQTSLPLTTLPGAISIAPPDPSGHAPPGFYTVPAETLIGRSELFGTVSGVDHYDWIVNGTSYGPLPNTDVVISAGVVNGVENFFRSDNYTYSGDAYVRLSSRSYAGLVALHAIDPAQVPKPSDAPSSKRYGFDWSDPLGLGLSAGTLALVVAGGLVALHFGRRATR